MQPIYAENAMSYEDYRALCKAEGTLRPAAFFGLLGFILLVFLFPSVPSMLTGVFNPMPLAVLLFILFLVVILPFTTRNAQRKYYDSLPQSTISLRQYIFDPAFLVVQSVDGPTRHYDEYLYSEIFKIFETGAHFLLFTNAKQAYVIPKHSLQNASPEALSAFLRAYIPPQKYVVKK